MATVLRRIGIAFGSFVIAWLGVSLIAGIVLGRASAGSGLVVAAAIAFGGFVYVDIIRREQRAP